MSSVSSTEENKVEITEEFKNKVVKYVEYDDKIKKGEKEVAKLREQLKLKELKTKRKECEDYILKHLDIIGETVVEISDGRLKKKKQEKTVAITYDMVKEALTGKVDDPEIVNSILKTVDDKRPIKETVQLARTVKK